MLFSRTLIRFNSVQHQVSHFTVVCRLLADFPILLGRWKNQKSIEKKTNFEYEKNNTESKGTFFSSTKTSTNANWTFCSASSKSFEYFDVTEGPVWKKAVKMLKVKEKHTKHFEMRRENRRQTPIKFLNTDKAFGGAFTRAFTLTRQQLVTSTRRQAIRHAHTEWSSSMFISKLIAQHRTMVRLTDSSTTREWLLWVNFSLIKSTESGSTMNDAAAVFFRLWREANNLFTENNRENSLVLNFRIVFVVISSKLLPRFRFASFRSS